MILSSGWFRARARPWNEAVTDPMIRLDRGGTDFLRAVVSHFVEIGELTVYSPALYPSATRVWHRAGFDEHESLDVMERSLTGARADPEGRELRIESEPDWAAVLDIDRLAFDGFWGMSELGLVEAYRASPNSALLVTPSTGPMGAYAIVGAQWTTVYLHRIAVRPDHTGLGLGAALVSAAMEWGHQMGGRSMILNVRPGNVRALHLYERLGFADTGTPLRVLRHRHIC